ncbi:MAG: DUF4115 domain-containing protein [Candidatus Aureabacteria bacterium]|nr:DUF4115 domain-containing protein [Candidatus Auribacterota bacterium]
MESIGEILHAARDERKAPIAQVSRDTKISERYIAAMEGNEFSILPALAYAKGFLKIYAEYLDLDPKPLVDQLMQEYGGGANQPFPVEEEVLLPHAATGVWKYTTIGVGGAILVVLALLSGVRLLRSCEKSRTVKSTAAETEELETLPLPALPTVRQVAIPAPQATQPAEPKVKQKKLMAKARDNVMVKVYADGVLLFNETIRKGKEESWLAKEGFDVRVSRPRMVDLALDGKPIREIKGREAVNLAIDKDSEVMVYKGKMRSE